MASSSGDEKNQNMVDSANKPADETIIPRKYTCDGILDKLKKQLNYVEPPYYVEEDPVADTDDPELESNVVEEEESMASSSGNENNQNMVDSAKAADGTTIPYENTIDGVLDKLRSQLRYVEPPYCGPGSDYVVEDPVSDTDDPIIKSNVVGDQRKRSLDMHTETEIEELPVRKKSRPRAIDTKWGRIVHDYELGLARAGKQVQDGFLLPQNLEERLFQLTGMSRLEFQTAV